MFNSFKDEERLHLINSTTSILDRYHLPENEKSYNSVSTRELSNVGKKCPQYTAALSVCMGSLAAGAVLGWTGNISEDMKAKTYNGIEIDDDSLGWIGSMATLGATVACFPIGKFCDWLGRKRAMLLLTIPFMLGWLLIIFANSLVMIYIGRFLTGMAGCAFCVSAPIYTSEIAEKDIRGALGSYFELLLTVGILFAYAVAMAVDMNTYTIIMAILPLIFAVVFFFQPESPVYTIKQNKEEEAVIALVRLRGKEYDYNTEIQDIKFNLVRQQNNNISFIESIKKKATLKAAFVVFSLMFFQQAGGINAVVFYTGTIFESAGSSLDSKISTIIVGAIQAIATFISSIVVDKLGRRILLITSNLLVTIAGTVLGIFFTLQDRNLVDDETLRSIGLLPVISLSIYVIMFSLGMGPIPWMLSAELFPPEIKSLAVGLAATINWFIAFLITRFYLNLQTAIGGDVTFYIFSVISFIGTIFIYLFVPETKGKTLDEIQKELNGEISNEEKSCS